MKKILIIVLIGMLTMVPLIGAYGMDDENSTANEEISNGVLEEALPEILELSLEEAMEYSLNHSRDIKIQDVSIMKAELTYEQSKSYLKNGKESTDKKYEYALMLPPANADMNINIKLLESGAKEKFTDLNYNMAFWNKENIIYLLTLIV